MSWRDSVKKEHMGITRAVIRHDAPVELEEPDSTFAGRPERITLYSYIDDLVKILLADKGWPKLPRRTPVTCPVTGEETYHPFGLSRRAWDLIEKGLVAEKEEERLSVGVKKYCFPTAWAYGLTKSFGMGLSYTPLQGKERFGPDYLHELILALLGKHTTETHVSHGKHPEDMGLIWLPVEEFDWKKLYDAKVKVVSLHPDEAEILRKAVSTVRYAHDKAVADALDEGSNLLLALAQDPESIEKFNAVRGDDGD